ncbi:MAG: Hint domain-containing protein [Pseudomonadota bacterium]
MTAMAPQFQKKLRATQALPVYRAEEFFVLSGVNSGEPLGFASELVLDDIYELIKGSKPSKLVVANDQDMLRITKASDVGTEGGCVVIDCTVTLMSPEGQTIEGLVLVEVEGDEAVDIFLLPLAHLAHRTEYTLVGVDTSDARRRFAEAACVAFTRGTHITMASGAQVPIEDLAVGDRVLTRDDGPQEIRWIGQNTRRAVGDFAPVLIKRGTLNNENDLVVSPDHRLFIYQRDDAIGAGRSEVLVKVRHLINGSSVVRLEGGFVDYFQLLFSSHQIIYAEGIAAESLLVDPRTRAALPEEINAALAQALPGHEDRHHLDYEVSETLLSKDAAERLRRASTR